MLPDLSKNGNYQLGAGKLFFRPEGQDGFIPLNETPSFSVTVDTEKVELWSVDTAIAKRLENVQTSRSITGAFPVREIEMSTLKLFLFGSIIELDQSAGAVGGSFDLVKGEVFPLIDTTAGRTRLLSDFAIAAATEGVDYFVDLERGLVYIPLSSSLNEESTDWTGTALADTRNMLAGGAGEPSYGELLFVADNTIGADFDITFPNVLLSPSGSMEGKDRDTFTELPFTFEAESDEEGNYMYILEY